MPVYEYQCQSCDAWQQAFRNYVSRDTDCPPCLDCNSDTRRGIYGATADSAPLPSSTQQFVEMYVKPAGLLDANSGRRYRLADIQCNNPECGHLEDTTECWLDENGDTAEPNPTCVKCGGSAEWVSINPGHSRFSEVFPYYDMGAGRWFQNKRERREWMRAAGVEEAGDLTDTMTRYERKSNDDDHKAFSEYEQLRDQYRNDPALRQVYRQLEDEGRGLPELKY